MCLEFNDCFVSSVTYNQNFRLNSLFSTTHLFMETAALRDIYSQTMGSIKTNMDPVRKCQASTK